MAADMCTEALRLSCDDVHVMPLQEVVLPELAFADRVRQEIKRVETEHCLRLLYLHVFRKQPFVGGKQLCDREAQVAKSNNNLQQQVAGR
jgi:hypothetical protein